MLYKFDFADPIALLDDEIKASIDEEIGELLIQVTRNEWPSVVIVQEILYDQEQEGVASVVFSVNGPEAEKLYLASKDESE